MYSLNDNTKSIIVLISKGVFRQKDNSIYLRIDCNSRFLKKGNYISYLSVFPGSTHWKGTTSSQ